MIWNELHIGRLFDSHGSQATFYGKSVEFRDEARTRICDIKLLCAKIRSVTLSVNLVAIQFMTEDLDFRFPLN